MSAGISSVGIQTVEREPSCTMEWIKWWQISICFEWAKIAGELENAQVVFKGPVWSRFLAQFWQTTTATSCLLWQDQKKPVQMGPNHLKQKFCHNLFEPTKTGIFVVFYT